jgi:hypothetical protein
MIRLMPILLLCCWAGTAWADYQKGNFTAAQTRFGALQVVGERGGQRLLFNGADLGLSNHALEIDGVWAVEGGAQDWAVISSYHGGNMCGGFALIAVMLTAEHAVRTEEFGICRGRPLDIRIDPGGMELDIGDPSPAVAHQTFRFDGRQITQQAVAPVAAPAAGGGADVTRWLTRHPQNMLQDPSALARLATIMPADKLEALAARMSGPGVTEQRGDWVVGTACQAHQCNTSGGAWALRISDGAPFVAFYEGKYLGEFFTGGASFRDPVIDALMAGR